MYTDNALRLATAEVTPNGGASPGGLGALSVTLGLDLSGLTQNLRVFNDPGAGKQLQMAVNVNTTVTSGTFASTLELQLVSIPIVASLLTNATTSGKTLTITGVVTDIADADATLADTLVIVGHGLPIGTPIHLTTIATTTGISTGTWYYVVPSTVDRFHLATTLANAIAGTFVDLTGGDGTVVVNFLPTVHATTGTLLKDRFLANHRLVVPFAPLTALTSYQALPVGQTLTLPLGTSPTVGLLTATAQRYFYLRYIPSATITAGAFTVDLVESVGAGGQTFYPSALVV